MKNIILLLALSVLCSFQLLDNLRGPDYKYENQYGQLMFIYRGSLKWCNDGDCTPLKKFYKSTWRGVRILVIDGGAFNDTLIFMKTKQGEKFFKQKDTDINWKMVKDYTK